MVQEILDVFAGEWTAHGSRLAAKATLKDRLFIVLEVDEAVASVTGCSIDKSVTVLKQIEVKFDVDLFDRFITAYRLPTGEIAVADREQLGKKIAEGIITENTLVFNNTIATSEELSKNWEIPFKDSWHARLF